MKAVGLGAKAFRALGRAVADPAYRADLLWYHLPRRTGVFQMSGATGQNRYPEIFRFVGDSLGHRADLRLLSFGCSTGEEVFTLRGYFPRAVIDGIDINPYRIRAARRRLRHAGGDPRLNFLVTASPERLPAASYDAVFCLAVLREGSLNCEPPPPRCDDWIRFADFERVIGDLARTVRPGGLLAIAHSNFRFADTAAASGFETVMGLGADIPDPQTPIYGRDNRLLAGIGYADALFRKRPELAASQLALTETVCPV